MTGVGSVVYKTRLSVVSAQPGKLLTAWRRETGEAASLAVLQDAVVVYVNHLPSEEAITVAPMLGVRRPIHVSAVGKAIWSHLPAAEQDRLFDPIARPLRLSCHLLRTTCGSREATPVPHDLLKT